MLKCIITSALFSSVDVGNIGAQALLLIPCQMVARSRPSRSTRYLLADRRRTCSASWVTVRPAGSLLPLAMGCNCACA